MSNMEAEGDDAQLFKTAAWWEELLKNVPELKPERDRLIAEGYKFEAYCL